MLYIDPRNKVRMAFSLVSREGQRALCGHDNGYGRLPYDLYIVGNVLIMFKEMYLLFIIIRTLSWSKY